MSVETRVTGRPRRAITLDGYTDLTGVAATEWIPANDRRGSLVFPATLTATQADAVWQRMTSANDADQALRAELRALSKRAQANPLDLTAVRDLAIATAKYALSDQADL